MGEARMLPCVAVGLWEAEKGGRGDGCGEQDEEGGGHRVGEGGASCFAVTLCVDCVSDAGQNQKCGGEWDADFGFAWDSKLGTVIKFVNSGPPHDQTESICELAKRNYSGNRNGGRHSAARGRVQAVRRLEQHC